MWSSLKSVKLSCVCTKLVMLLVVCLGVSLPSLMDRYVNLIGWNIDAPNVTRFMIILYACCIPALTALVSLDRLLANIKREDVFIQKNVLYLRIISWCCFSVAFILLFAGYYYLLFIVVAIVTAFIGLILRVVKNVIEQAVIMKIENDFTI